MWEKISAFFAFLFGSSFIAWLSKNWHAKNEKRKKSYQEIKKILDGIGKETSSLNDHKKAGEEMKKWQLENEGYLLLKKYPVRTKQSFLNKKEGTYFLFNELRRLLKKNPQFENRYSKDQLKKLREKKNELVRLLFAEATPLNTPWQQIAEKLTRYF